MYSRINRKDWIEGFHQEEISEKHCIKVKYDA